MCGVKRGIGRSVNGIGWIAQAFARRNHFHFHWDFERIKKDCVGIAGEHHFHWDRARVAGCHHFNLDFDRVVQALLDTITLTQSLNG